MSPIFFLHVNERGACLDVFPGRAPSCNCRPQRAGPLTPSSTLGTWGLCWSRLQYHPILHQIWISFLKRDFIMWQMWHNEDTFKTGDDLNNIHLRFYRLHYTDRPSLDRLQTCTVTWAQHIIHNPPLSHLIRPPHNLCIYWEPKKFWLNMSSAEWANLITIQHSTLPQHQQLAN